MSHEGTAKGVVLLRPDGTPMTKREVIKRRRGAFKWLPVLCSNDLVHGSWWFVWGSLCCAAFAVIPLIQNYESFYHQHDDLLPQADFEATWGLLVFSGIMFTIGSLAFVRAFEEPPKIALLHGFKHFQTDELLGAWFFLFGTFPAIPYTLLYFISKPSAVFFGAMVLAIMGVAGTGLFVVACYPSDKAGPRKNHALPCCIWAIGAQLWIVKHLANDWLAGTWFFFWANLIVTIGSIFLLFIAIGLRAQEQIFLWISGSSSSLLFLIGSFYFVSGSYPHAQQFYYAVDRGQTAELTYKPPTNLPDYSRADDAEPSVLEDIFFIGRNNKGKDQAYIVTHGDELEATEGAHMGDRDRDARGLRDTDADTATTTAENPLHSREKGKGKGQQQHQQQQTQPQPRWLEEGESKSDKLLAASSSSSSSVGYASSSGAPSKGTSVVGGSGTGTKSNTSTPPPTDLTPSPPVGGLLDVGDEDENRDDDDEEVDPDRDHQSARSTGSLASTVPLRDAARDRDVSLHGDVGKIIEDDD